MGRINHIIHVEPIAAKGIIIHNEEMNGKKNILSQISCTVCLKSNPKVRSKFSMPIRQKVNQKTSETSVCEARWCNNDDDECNFSFETKLNGRKAKVFEFSVRLRRGEEEIDIGVSSLTFVGVVLSAELDIPIYAPDSKEARAISEKCNEKNGFFRSKNNNADSEIIKDIRSQMRSIVQGAKTFRGGDGGRSYSIEPNASIRVKCTCLPTYGNTDMNSLKRMLQKERKLHLPKTSFPNSDTTSFDPDNISEIQSRGRSATSHPVYYSDSISLSIEPSSEIQDRYKVNAQYGETSRSKPTLKTRIRSEPTRRPSPSQTPNHAQRVRSYEQHVTTRSIVSMKDKYGTVKDNISFEPEFVDAKEITSYQSDLLENDKNYHDIISLSSRDILSCDETSSPFRGLFSEITDDESISIFTRSTQYSVRRPLQECSLPNLAETFDGTLLKKKLNSIKETMRETISPENSSTTSSLFSDYSCSEDEDENDENFSNISFITDDFHETDKGHGNFMIPTNFSNFVKQKVFCQ